MNIRFIKSVSFLRYKLSLKLALFTHKLDRYGRILVGNVVKMNMKVATSVDS